MYLQPEVRYDGVSVIGASEDEDLHGRVVCFMLVVLKISIPVIRTQPITKLSTLLIIDIVEDIILQILNM